jgi:hypothetical protein
MRLVIVVAGIVMLFTACARGLPDRAEDAAAMEAAVLRVVPIGTAIDDARRRLDAQGFRCAATRFAPFAGEADSLNYAYCDGSSRSVFVTRRFQLALVDSGGLLSRVRVTTGLIGP